MMDAARRPMPLCRWVLTSLRLWNPNLRWRRPRVGRGHLTRTATMLPARPFPARQVRAPALLLASRPTSMTLKPITEGACYSWVAFGQAVALLPAPVRTGPGRVPTEARLTGVVIGLDV